MTRTTLASAASLLALVGAANAQIAFQAPFSVFAGNQPSAVAAADIDGDGDQDYVVTVDNQDALVAFINDGTGNFSQGQFLLLGGNAGAGDVVAFDADNDGDDDFAIAYQNQAQIVIVTNQAGVLAVSGSAGVGPNPRGLATGDFNSDGFTDLAVANRDGNSASFLANTGAGFTVQTVPAGLDPRHAALLDIDGDGDLDALVSNNDSDNITVYTNNAGSFAASGTIAGLPDSPEGLAVGDWDGDGDTDFASTGDGFAFIFTNNAGSFGFPAFVSTASLSTDDIIAADFDCDGDLDLATANQDSNTMSVLTNNGGTFGTVLTIAAGAAPQQLVAADFDGNGSPDLVVANRNSSDVTVALNVAVCGGGPLTGACCLRGVCTDGITANDCIALGGTYLGDDSVCGPNACPQVCLADIDGDGDVDSDDLGILLNEFGQGCN